MPLRAPLTRSRAELRRLPRALRRHHPVHAHLGMLLLHVRAPCGAAYRALITAQSCPLHALLPAAPQVRRARRRPGADRALAAAARPHARAHGRVAHERRPRVGRPRAPVRFTPAAPLIARG
jgi:hypothetical protein